MRSRLFRTMGASLSLAASIALSAGSTQALVGPGRGGSTTQSNLAQSQARWPLGGDPSDLTSDTQQDTTGQLDVRERNENGPFTLGAGSTAAMWRRPTSRWDRPMTRPRASRATRPAMPPWIRPPVRR